MDAAETSILLNALAPARCGGFVAFVARGAGFVAVQRRQRRQRMQRNDPAANDRVRSQRTGLPADSRLSNHTSATWQPRPAPPPPGSADQLRVSSPPAVA